jgi:hypothetical protein
MTLANFKIEIISTHWLENYDDPDDRCVHGKVKVIFGNEIVAENSDDPNDWFTLSAMALHLLRTLETNHTEETPVAQCLVPGDGYHIDHRENQFQVHIETLYPMVYGYNWWVTHIKDKVKLETIIGNISIIPFEIYKKEILNFADKIEEFYKKSSPKNLPEIEYDKIGYLKFWNEWHTRRNNWN